MGISKRSDGHIQMNDDICFIGYAYSSGGPDSGFWGKWATRFQKIKLSTYEGDIKDTDKGGKGTLITDYAREPYKESELWTVGI